MGIELHHKTYILRMTIPKDVRAKLGKRMFRISLKTNVPDIAEERAAVHRANWKAQIRAARGNPATNDETYWNGGPVLAPARRRLLDPQPDGSGRTQREVWQLEQIDDQQARYEKAADIEYRLGTVSDAVSVKTGAYVDEWLASRTTAPKTKDMHRSDVNRFASEFPTLATVQRPAVKRWTTALMNNGGLSPKTVQRALSALRGYWRYCQTIKVVGEEDPFSKLDIASQSKRAGQRGKRLGFEPAQVVALLNGAVADGDAQLADLIRLGMWSGCRIEEIAALKITEVATDRFRVTDAKTDAGVRVVPIHSQLAPIMESLVKASTDDYVISGLTFNKYGDRSNAIGKRFGRLKAAMGFGRELVFHSLRHGVVQQLERLGVHSNVVADLVGHEREGITFGVYGGGQGFAGLKAAIELLSYPLPSG